MNRAPRGGEEFGWTISPEYLILIQETMNQEFRTGLEEIEAVILAYEQQSTQLNPEKENRIKVIDNFSIENAKQWIADAEEDTRVANINRKIVEEEREALREALRNDHYSAVRYRTGLSRWEHEKDEPDCPHCAYLKFQKGESK